MHYYGAIMFNNILVMLIISILAGCTSAPKIQDISSANQGVIKAAGAKSIFSSDDGVALSVTDSSPSNTESKPHASTHPTTHNRKPSPVASYQGMSYWIERISRNGSPQQVTTSTVFKSGDRIRLHLKSKLPGYLYIVNQDSTGKTAVLFPNSTTTSEYIESGIDYVIPSSRAIRFDDQAGQELLWIFLTQQPLPSDGQKPASNRPAATQASYNPCGGKGMLLEEPANLGRKCGSKGLQLEEDTSGPAPAEYAVAPVSDAEPGAILNLRLTLRHE